MATRRREGRGRVKQALQLQKVVPQPGLRHVFCLTRLWVSVMTHCEHHDVAHQVALGAWMFPIDPPIHLWRGTPSFGG